MSKYKLIDVVDALVVTDLTAIQKANIFLALPNVKRFTLDDIMKGVKSGYNGSYASQVNLCKAIHRVMNENKQNASV